MEIDLYHVGYFIGRWGTRYVKCVSVVKLATSGVRGVKYVAEHHKIDSNNPAAVTENIFKCLKYLD